MIVINCKQGTPEWLQARSGVITASRFEDAISVTGGLDTKQKRFVDMVLGGLPEKAAWEAAGYKAAPKSETVAAALRGENTEKPSDESEKYACDVAIEICSGQPWGIPVKAWVLDRGHELESDAKMQYELRHDATTTDSGIILTDDRRFGYSSDGLVGDDGLVEVKCPIDSRKVFAMWRTQDISEYEAQIQGGLWLTGRKWCDLIVYVPDLKPVGKDLFVKRIFRNEEYIADLETRLWEFAKRVDANVAFLKSK